jgi:protein-S-isoprenylcysteine O-methyltransferase Ste14
MSAAAYGTAITCLWLIFLAYWFVSALRAKPTVGGRWRGAPFRVLVGIGIALLVRELVREHAPQAAPHAVAYLDPIVAGAGVGLCALGIAIAIWARAFLGRNWGAPMSLREGHELVTTGPYAVVRHPIYSGISLALLGTSLAAWFPWIVVTAAAFAYFVYAARVEEDSMRAQFPDVYPTYAKRTKMLIPYIV